MLLDDIEVFWDGEAGVALGFPHVPEHAGVRPTFDIRVVAPGAAGSTLLDAFRIGGERSAHGRRFVRLPPERDRIVVIVEEEGATQDSVEVVFTSADQLRGSNFLWNLLLVELPVASRDAPVVRCVHAIPSERDSLVDREIARSGSRLVWAVLQARWDAPKKARVRKTIVSPTEQVWPRREGRLIVNAQSRHASAVPGRDDERVPPAEIMGHARREQRRLDVPTLMLHRMCGGRTGERRLGRDLIVHVMHQRRHLRQRNGAPGLKNEISEPLTSADIQTALGSPVALPGADKGEDIAFCGLATAIDSGGARGAEDDSPFLVRHLASGPDPGDKQVEIVFTAAGLGDDVGVVSGGSGAGESMVLPNDPGGSRRARLFRVEMSGLEPRAIEEGDELLEELVKLATREPDTAYERTVAAVEAEWKQRQARLVGELRGRVGDAELAADLRTDRIFESPLGPLVAVSYVEQIAGVTDDEVLAALRKLGAWRAYARDPAVLCAIAARPDLIRSGELVPATSGHLAARLAALRGTPDLVDADLDLEGQVAALRILFTPWLAEALATAGIKLAGRGDAMAARAATVAERLCGNDAVQDALRSNRQRGRRQQVEQLEAFLERQRAGRWTPLAEAEALAEIVEEVHQFRDEMRRMIRPDLASDLVAVEHAEALRSAVADLIRRAAALDPLPREIRSYQGVELEQLDGVILREMHDALERIVGSAGVEELFERIVGTLEDWAELAGFSRSVSARLALREFDSPTNSRANVESYVSRVISTLPAADDTGPFRTEFEKLCRALHRRLEPLVPSLEDRSHLEQDLAQYGYILLFHKAHRAITELIERAAKDDAHVARARRLARRLDAWPRAASRTWSEAVSVASDLSGGAVEVLQARVEPPQL
jgi:hypothetical protein